MPAAFSLVETVMAVGIVAFAFVSLIAMLPIGLATFRSAVDQSVGAQISQRIVTDAEQADFNEMLEQAETTKDDFYALETRYFDDQGNEIIPRGGEMTEKEKLRALYQVRVRGSMPGDARVAAHSADYFTSLPCTGSPFNPRDTTFLTIQIANNPGNHPISVNSVLLWDTSDAASKGIAIATHSAVVTRNGRKPGIVQP